MALMTSRAVVMFVITLEAALRCFYNTNSIEEAILIAANLGYDAETTTAIFGQLAGAHYGTKAIPHSWVNKLAMRSAIFSLANQLFGHTQKENEMHSIWTMDIQ